MELVTDIQIEVNGIRYTGWESVSVTKTIETLCGSFEFDGSFTKGKTFPVKVNDECKIYVNDTAVVNGYVETLKVSIDASTHRLSISGRDRTCDLVDNTLSPAIPLPKLPATVKQIIEKVLQFYGMTNIKVIDPYNLAPIKEVITAELGQTAEDLIQQYASKRNVLITTNNDGDIVFQRAGTDIYKTILTRNKKDYQVIKGSDMSFDNTKRFHEYRITDQGNSMSDYYIGNQSTTKQNSDVSAKDFDEEIRKTRIYYLSSDDTSEDEDVKKRVKWEGNFRRAQSVVYECDVVGFKPLLDNGIWLPNKLVRIDDVESNITNATLLISSVTFKKDNNEGSITHLKCVPQDSFTLQLNKPKKQKSDELDFGKFYVKDLSSGDGNNA